jgi:hypothetical protein
MGASLTLAISIITSLLPLIKAGTQAYKDITEARDAIKTAQAAGRDLTNEEFTAFMAKAYAAGNELRDLAAAADAETIPPAPEATP